MSVLNDADALKLGNVPVLKAYMDSVEVYSASTGAPNIKDDEFNDGSIDPVWTITDPNSPNGTVSESGTTLTMSIPSGTEYDPSNVPAEPLTLLQDVADEDFTLEIRATPVPAEKYSWTGIWVREDGDHWARFCVRSNGRANKNNVESKYASGDSGTTDVYEEHTGLSEVRVKVARSGDDWTFSYWNSGGSYTTYPTYTHSMVVNQVGLFVATYSLDPAHSADFDWFREVS